MPRPLTELPLAQAKEITWLLTDVDDTLTWDGTLPAETLQALNQLKNVGIKVIAVTGACAGWCDQIAKLWPVHGVIGENGAFWMQKNETGFRTHSLIPMEQMREQQKKLLKLLSSVLRDYPGIEFANDQPFRFCDVAINLGQDREPVNADVAARLLHSIRSLTLEGQQVHATQSSIHINVWIGDHNKRYSSERYLKDHTDFDRLTLNNISYIGDSLNDESMFAWLPVTFGVSNITPLLEKLGARPSYITNANGGYGFAELAARLVKARQR